MLNGEYSLKVLISPVMDIICVWETVDFYIFVLFQVNEETGNRRPVMLTVQRVPRVPKPAKTGSMTDSEKEEGDRGKAEETQTDPGDDWIGATVLV